MISSAGVPSRQLPAPDQKLEFSRPGVLAGAIGSATLRLFAGRLMSCASASGGPGALRTDIAEVRDSTRFVLLDR